MEGMEEKLGAILGNPDMMQQIMAMAQTLGQPPAAQPQPQESKPDIDPAIITKVMHLAGQTNIDPNQRALLRALDPYLAHHRIEKLEKAMRAAKLATLASAFLEDGGFAQLTGR